jgi:hypothetical protein
MRDCLTTRRQQFGAQSCVRQIHSLSLLREFLGDSMFKRCDLRLQSTARFAQCRLFVVQQQQQQQQQQSQTTKVFNHQ